MRTLTFMMAMVLAAAACRTGVPVVDPSPKSTSLDGTISGRVLGEDGSRLSARKLDFTNVATGARLSVTSDANGAFTIKVPPGKYKPQVELRAGESLAKAPSEIDINQSDLDANIEFVIRPS